MSWPQNYRKFNERLKAVVAPSAFRRAYRDRRKDGSISVKLNCLISQEDRQFLRECADKLTYRYGRSRGHKNRVKTERFVFYNVPVKAAWWKDVSHLPFNEAWKVRQVLKRLT